MDNLRRALWTDAEVQYLRDNYTRVSYAQIGTSLGRSTNACQRKAVELGLRINSSLPSSFTVEPVPTASRPIEEIFEDQAKRFQEKGARWGVKHEGIKINLSEPGPYAIYFAGDPHVGDDGCDLERLAYELTFIQTQERIFAANMGDLSNNWIRALGHLYAHQHTTDDEEIALVEWLVTTVPWLFVILGNHDKWSPLAAHICSNHKVPYVSHGAIFKVISGDSTLTIDARHTHKGHSQYNPSFAQAKRSYRGSPADIIIGAHTHVSGYTMLCNGLTGKISHSIRVGSFKKFDEYADQGNFDQDWISPSVLAVINPSASPSGFVTIFHDIEVGAKFLSMLLHEASENAE